MRGPRVGAMLLLLLLLLGGLTRTVFCQEEEEASDDETPEVTDAPDAGSETTVSAATDTTHLDVENEEDRGSGRGSGRGSENAVDATTEVPSSSEEEEESFDLLLIVIPLVLVVLIIIIIVCCVFINHSLNRNRRPSQVGKDDPFSEGSSTEKVPMPMFEEDVPSVLELEMEDLDGWIKKDGEVSDPSQKA